MQNRPDQAKPYSDNQVDVMRGLNGAVTRPTVEDPVDHWQRWEMARMIATLDARRERADADHDHLIEIAAELGIDYADWSGSLTPLVAALRERNETLRGLLREARVAPSCLSCHYTRQLESGRMYGNCLTCRIDTALASTTEEPTKKGGGLCNTRASTETKDSATRASMSHEPVLPTDDGGAGSSTTGDGAASTAKAREHAEQGGPAGVPSLSSTGGGGSSLVYVTIRYGPSARQELVNDGEVVIDYGTDGQIRGVEVITARRVTVEECKTAGDGGDAVEGPSSEAETASCGDLAGPGGTCGNDDCLDCAHECEFDKCACTKEPR